MKKNQNQESNAFSLRELLVVIAVICVFVLLAIPSMAGSRSKSIRMVCASNLRQISIAFKVWEGGNGAFFPQLYAGSPQHPIINSANPNVPTQGAFWSASGNNAPNMYTVYLAMSNELNRFQMLVCPADAGRSAPTSYSNLIANKDNSVSYFIGENATETSPHTFLAGDRNISSDTTITTLPYGYSPNSFSSPGAVATIGTNLNASPLSGTNFGWTAKIHNGAGNVAFADGSVQQLNNTTNSYSLKRAFNLTGDTNTSANTILFP